MEAFFLSSVSFRVFRGQFSSHPDQGGLDHILHILPNQLLPREMHEVPALANFTGAFTHGNG